MSQFEIFAEDIKQEFTVKNNYQFDKTESALLTLLLINLLIFLIKLFLVWWLTKEEVFKKIKERHRFVGAAIRTELFFNNEFRMLSRQQKLKLRENMLNKISNLSYEEFLKLYEEVQHAQSYC